MTVHDGQAHVGQFGLDPEGHWNGEGYYGAPVVQRYDTSPDGSFRPFGDPTLTPYGAQGVAVTKDGIHQINRYGLHSDR